MWKLAICAVVALIVLCEAKDQINFGDGHDYTAEHIGGEIRKGLGRFGNDENEGRQKRMASMNVYAGRIVAPPAVPPVPQISESTRSKRSPFGSFAPTVSTPRPRVSTRSKRQIGFGEGGVGLNNGFPDREGFGGDRDIVERERVIDRPGFGGDVVERERRIEGDGFGRRDGFEEPGFARRGELRRRDGFEEPAFIREKRDIYDTIKLGNEAVNGREWFVGEDGMSRKKRFACAQCALTGHVLKPADSTTAPEYSPSRSKRSVIKDELLVGNELVREKRGFIHITPRVGRVVSAANSGHQISGSPRVKRQYGFGNGGFGNAGYRRGYGIGDEVIEQETIVERPNYGGFGGETVIRERTIERENPGYGYRLGGI